MSTQRTLTFHRTGGNVAVATMANWAIITEADATAAAYFAELRNAP